MRLRHWITGGGILGVVLLGLTPEAHSASKDWRPLFDGKTYDGWRGLRQEAPPKTGWKIEDGILKKVAGVRGGNLVTEATFEQFEFAWEWRIPAGANNGVKYFVLEERGGAIGHEYQMIDDTRSGGGKHVTGSFYDVLPPESDRPPTRIGEWNESRIVVRGQTVEHWLNGKRILTYELGSPEVMAAVADSKFKKVEQFGTRVRGHIMLTDHNDEAWFRNIRVRVLGDE